MGDHYMCVNFEHRNLRHLVWYLRHDVLVISDIHTQQQCNRGGTHVNFFSFVTCGVYDHVTLMV